MDLNLYKDQNGKTFVKEFAAVNVNTTKMQSFMFLLSPDASVDVPCCGTRNFGHFEYKELQNIVESVTKPALVILAYGKEKCDLLEKLLNRSITDVTRVLNCPDPTKRVKRSNEDVTRTMYCPDPKNVVSESKVSCLEWRHHETCALTTAHIMAQWLQSHQGRTLGLLRK